jgi:hypothetical protein
VKNENRFERSGSPGDQYLQGDLHALAGLQDVSFLDKCAVLATAVFSMRGVPGLRFSNQQALSLVGVNRRAIYSLKCVSGSGLR